MAENFQNFYVTKLREACDASATTIYVDNPPNFSEGTLVIEFSNSTKHEIIHFTGKSGYGLTGCTRGHEGTTAQSHSAGVDVRQNVTAGILDKIINRAITTENIADNAVTTTKINNGAVTADKIDFTTLGSLCATNAGSFTTNGVWTNRVSITVPAGTYIIQGYCVFENGSTSASGESRIRFSYEGVISNDFVSFLNSSQYSSTTTMGYLLVTINSRETISLQTSVDWSNRGTYTTRKNNCGLSAIRVS